MCYSMTSVIDATIDFSPNPCAKDLTLVLYEDDLVHANPAQIERFLRVWVSERNLSAPKLHNLTIELITDTEMKGIKPFLQQFQALQTTNTVVNIRLLDGRLHTFVALHEEHDLPTD
jgi:hypothetical protein